MKLPYKGAGVALFKNMGELYGYGVLIGKRTNNPGKGKWSIPGGEYDSRDKDLKGTAEREFREEMELDLFRIVQGNEPVIHRMRFPLFTWNTYMYDVGSWSLPATRIHEFSEMKFVPVSELGKYDLAFGVKQEVRAFMRKHNRRSKRMQKLIKKAISEHSEAMDYLKDR